MYFSHTLLKKFVPKLSSKQKVIDAMNMHLFEAEDPGGSMIDLSKLPPNRYSDASSYWGMSRLLAVVLGVPYAKPKRKKIMVRSKKRPRVEVRDKAFCRRMTARVIEDVSIKPSPPWLKKVLKDHGMNSINNLVDATNYGMLMTGQPTHAFDFSKMKDGTLVVRKAKKGESLTTLDKQKFKMSPAMHVLADSQNALDIAAIKGGTKAELNAKTKTVLLTAGSFDGVTVYNTSRALNLATDASQRFSHNLSPELAADANDYVTELILELCGGKAGSLVDVYSKKPHQRIIGFHIDRFNAITGLQMSMSEATRILKKLGFSVTGKRVRVPLVRDDIAVFEDLVEEVAAFHGYENIDSKAPYVSLVAPDKDATAVMREKVRDALVGLGCDEVYNYSFVSKDQLEATGGVGWWKAVELENPVSEKYAYLRPSLSLHLADNAKKNLRFYETVRLFEVGRNTTKKSAGVLESRAVGVVIAARSGNPVLELRGIVEALLSRVGLIHFDIVQPTFDLPYMDKRQTVFVQSGNTMVGYLGVMKSGAKGTVALFEGDLEKIERLAREEKEYLPISKYPTVTRDISLFVASDIRVGDMLAAIQKGSPSVLRDVDLIDYYEPGHDEKQGQKSLAFRLVFQSNSRTLTDDEVSKEATKIEGILKRTFGAQIR